MARKSWVSLCPRRGFDLSGYLGITHLASGVLTGRLRLGSFPVETLTRQPKLVQKSSEFSGDGDTGAFGGSFGDMA